MAAAPTACVTRSGAEAGPAPAAPVPGEGQSPAPPPRAGAPPDRATEPRCGQGRGTPEEVPAGKHQLQLQEGPAAARSPCPSGAAPNLSCVNHSITSSSARNRRAGSSRTEQ
ncbi:uncharacterized protein LOC128816077 [Vidua macroura]|uniref:uncharacterized protein LOC128816077 n=1 Tax=Vidua macroura TaxID=187451 RepID=UPI0023A7BF6B|nr:uncharacterized protein LOC128816077 [Vidua macroura]